MLIIPFFSPNSLIFMYITLIYRDFNFLIKDMNLWDQWIAGRFYPRFFFLFSFFYKYHHYFIIYYYKTLK